MDENQHEIPKCVDPIGSASMTLDEFKAKHAESIADPNAFWSTVATEHLTWYKPFDQALDGGFEHGDVNWFAGGKLNTCYNAIDRWALTKPNQTAILWEGDEPDDIRRVTYAEMKRKVSQIANALTAQGVKKGDVVTIYMPMMYVCVVVVVVVVWYNFLSHRIVLPHQTSCLQPGTPHDHVGLCSHRGRPLGHFRWLFGRCFGPACRRGKFQSHCYGG